MVKWIVKCRLVGILPVIAIVGCGGSGGGTSGTVIRAAQGGQVQRGGATLTIPPNSLTRDTIITAQSASSVPAPPTDKTVVAGTAYEFGPSGTTFSPPATLRVRYDQAQVPSGVNEAELAIYVASGNTWTALEGQQVDSSANTVTASVSHFSKFAILAPKASSSGEWELIDLGVLPGFNTSAAQDINNAGQVLVNLSSSLGTNVHGAAIWQGGSLTGVGSLPNRSYVYGERIDGSGRVYGRAGASSDFNSQTAFRYDGSMALFDPFNNGYPVRIVDVSESGMIATVAGPDWLLITPTGNRDLPYRAVAVNDAGLVATELNGQVGTYMPGGQITMHGKPQGSLSAQVSRINTSAQIAGTYSPGDGTLRGYLYTGGTFTDLGIGTNQGGSQTVVADINASGHVVGTTSGSTGMVYLYRNGQLIDLQTKVPTGSTFQYLISATGINDQGWIVGSGQLRTGEVRAFLMKPR